jgi:predicted MFS family arabinose efflux permease
VIRLTIAGGGIACVVAAAAPSLAVLLVARGLAGVFFAAIVPTSITYTGDTVAEGSRQHALALLMAAATAGTATATIVSGAVVQVAGWREPFLISALLAAVLTVWMASLPEPPVVTATRSLLERATGVLRDRWVYAVLAIAFVEGAVIFGALTFIAAALQEDGVAAALAGFAVAGFGIGNVVMTPLVTRAIPRLPSPVLIGGGAAVAAAGLLLAGLHLTVATAIVATLSLGAGFGFLHSTLQLWATQVHPAARAITVSFFAGAVFTGGAAASALAAPLADAGRFSTIFLACAAAALALALAGSLLRARWVVRRADAVADDGPLAVSP